MALSHATQPVQPPSIQDTPERLATVPLRSRDCLHLVLEPVQGGEAFVRAATTALAVLPHPAGHVGPRPAGSAASTVASVTLRHPDLVADPRKARAERFGNVYEMLALRRRRAQIAARRALEGR